MKSASSSALTHRYGAPPRLHLSMHSYKKLAVLLLGFSVSVGLLGADTAGVTFKNTCADALSVEISLFAEAGHEEVVKTIELSGDQSVKVILDSKVTSDEKVVVRVTRNNHTGEWYGVKVNEERGKYIVDLP